MSLFDRFRKERRPELRREPSIGNVSPIAEQRDPASSHMALRQQITALYDQGVDPLHAILRLMHDEDGTLTNNASKVFHLWLGVNDILERDDIKAFLRSDLVRTRNRLATILEDSSDAMKNKVAELRELYRNVSEMAYLQSFKVNDADGVISPAAYGRMLAEIERERAVSAGSRAQDISEDTLARLYYLRDNWDDPNKLNSETQPPFPKTNSGEERKDLGSCWNADHFPCGYKNSTICVRFCVDSILYNAFRWPIQLRPNKTSIALTLALLSSIDRTAQAQASLPDRGRTPGALNPAVTQATIGQTICNGGWTSTIRPPKGFTSALKRRQLRELGYADQRMGSYEEDHLIPLGLGGAPADPHNLWPEPRESSDGWSAARKDDLEGELNHEVCAGRVPLAEAQRAIATDWTAAYGRYMAAAQARSAQRVQQPARPPALASSGQCPGDVLVWVNTRSGIYHYPGQRYYGTTRAGRFLCEKDALAEGDRATRNGE